MIRYFVQMSGIYSTSKKELATYIYIYIYIYIYTNICGPGSSVGIATDYGMDGPGSNPVGTRFSARPDRPWGPPSLM